MSLLNSTEMGSGCLTVIVGPMFSGKITRLLALGWEGLGSGWRVVCIQRDIDNHYGTPAIQTHDGIQLEQSI